MDAIRVIPEDTEVVGRARHAGQAAYHLVGIGCAAGVGILRHAPDALDRSIFGNQALHLVHIRAVLVHGNGDHLDAKGLGHAEVPIVTRTGAQPFHLVKLAPRRMAQRAEHPTTSHGVVHDVQAGVAEHHHMLGVIVEHGGHKALRLGNAVEHAVVSAVRAIFGGAVVDIDDTREHGHAQVKLCAGGLAARHVQSQPLRLERLVFAGERIAR